MRLGPLFVGWVPITESERIEAGLDAVMGGWELLCVEWSGRGFGFLARPAEAGAAGGHGWRPRG